MTSNAVVDWIGFRASFSHAVHDPNLSDHGPGVIDCDGVSGLLGFCGFTVSPWLVVRWQRERLWTGSDFMV